MCVLLLQSLNEDYCTILWYSQFESSLLNLLHFLFARLTAQRLKLEYVLTLRVTLVTFLDKRQKRNVNLLVNVVIQMIPPTRTLSSMPSVLNTTLQSRVSKLPRLQR